MKKETYPTMFRQLPEETRTAALIEYVAAKIKWLEDEKKAATTAHQDNLSRINTRIKMLTKRLGGLKKN